MRYLMRRFVPFAACLALVACATVGAPRTAAARPPTSTTRASAPPVQRKTVLSPEYYIDKKYRSMEGPYGQQKVYLADPSKPELLWITGYETEVVDPADGSKVSQEYMCHANLDVKPGPYMKQMKMRHGISGRIFTLSQGQQKIEFPSGFGIPILSTEPLDLTTQVLNLNRDDPELVVRHKVTVEFVRDRDVPKDHPMKPLFQSAVEGLKSLEGPGKVYGVADSAMDHELQGAGCAVGASAIHGDADLDSLGRKFTAHWLVKPGLEVNHTLVTKFLDLPFDTTIHYIAVHLHPFAKSLELIDRTTGRSLFKAEVDPARGRIGIDRVDHLSSPEGIPVYKDHQYGLVSVYDNTSGEDQDSMAVMYLYLLDKGFTRPAIVH